MRLTSLFVLGLAALAPTTQAVRTGASSTLARLSERLAAAEAALAELKAQKPPTGGLVETNSLAYKPPTGGLVETNSKYYDGSIYTGSVLAEIAPGPTPTSQYTFDSQNYYDKINTANKGTISPAGSSNIGFAYDNSRASYVVARADSKTYTTSSVVLPTQLSSAFTVSLWFNWAGTGGSEQHIIDSADSSFQLYLDGSGHLNAVVNGVTQTDTTVLPSLQWHFIAVTVGANSFNFFSGTKSGITKVGSVSATYPGSATTLRIFNAGASPAATKSFAGSIDSVTVFNYALADSDVSDVWWGTNNGASPTGQAPTAPNQYSFYGHFSQAQVTFSNRYAGQPAGDITITIAVSDIDVAYGDEIRVRFYGCSGTATNGYVTLADGTQASYNNLNGIVSLFPPAKEQKGVSPTGVQYTLSIAQGSTYTFTLPASLIQVTNPTTIYASASDPNWKIGQVFSSGQIPQTGIHYVGVLVTPQTLTP